MVPMKKTQERLLKPDKNDIAPQCIEKDLFAAFAGRLTTYVIMNNGYTDISVGYQISKKARTYQFNYTADQRGKNKNRNNSRAVQLELANAYANRTTRVMNAIQHYYVPDTTKKCEILKRYFEKVCLRFTVGQLTKDWQMLKKK